MRRWKDGLLVFTVLAATVASACAQSILNGNPLQGLEQLKDFRAMRSSSSDVNWKDGNGDARPIEPGATLTIADLEGPGQIAHIWCTIAASDKWYSRLLVIRMYWDGEKTPSVEAPIGDFFAAGHGIDAYVDSLPVRVTSEGRARNCYWPMPFRKSARITITNEGKGRVHAFYYYVDWQKKKKSLPKDTAYFHAQYRQAVPNVADGKNYSILEAQGAGHYVGTVQSVRLNENGWYGEGDDFFYIDGETEPSLKGTGTEDYFCDAWGFRKLDGLFYGLPIMEGFAAGDKLTAYRWHIADPIPFTKSLKVEIEHKGSRDGVGGYVERYDDFYTVAYWYQTEPHAAFPKLPDALDRLPYNPNELVQAEDLLASAVSKPEGKLKLQQHIGSGAGQAFFTPTAVPASFTLKMLAAKDGKYDVVLNATTSFDYGIYQAKVNGKNIGGAVDYYSASTGSREIRLGQVELKTGSVELTFEGIGKNPASSGVYFGVDSVVLRHLK